MDYKRCLKDKKKNKSEPQLNEKCIIGTILFWISLKYHKIKKNGLERWFCQQSTHCTNITTWIRSSHSNHNVSGTWKADLLMIIQHGAFTGQTRVRMRPKPSYQSEQLAFFPVSPFLISSLQMFFKLSLNKCLLGLI